MALEHLLHWFMNEQKSTILYKKKFYPDIHVIEVLEWSGCAKHPHSTYHWREPTGPIASKSNDTTKKNKGNPHHTFTFAQSCSIGYIGVDFSLSIYCSFVYWQSLGDRNGLCLLTKCSVVIHCLLPYKQEILQQKGALQTGQQEATPEHGSFCMYSNAGYCTEFYAPCS